jgi:hypothetical protein
VAFDVSWRMRVARALGVAAIFALGVVPVLVGEPRCNFARLFHAPCPGCGMTRAVHLLEAGDVAASLAMHPFAVPVIVASGAFAASMVWATYALATPLRMWESRACRASVFGLAGVYVACIVFWGLRAVGLFGGPVPV